MTDMWQWSEVIETQLLFDKRIEVDFSWMASSKIPK